MGDPLNNFSSYGMNNKKRIPERPETYDFEGGRNFSKKSPFKNQK